MMNHFDWEDSVRRGHISMKTQQKDSMENPGGTHGSRSYYQYRADTLDGPANRLQTVQSASAGRCPSTNNFHLEKAELFHPDGKPLDPDQEDHEFTRKLKELRGTEESIRCKKAAVGCKTGLEPSPPASGEASDRCTRPTLKDRVDAILQQRQSSGFLAKSHFQKHRIKSSGPRNDGQRPGDHPLKTRVNALMKHRMSRPSVSPSNTKRPGSSPAEDGSIDQGFQRFLDVLNKGVDVNLLRKIVNDDAEDRCLDDKVQDSRQLKTPYSPFGSKSRHSNHVIPLPEHSGSGERSSDPRSRERPRSALIAGNDENKEEALSPKPPSDSPSGTNQPRKEDEARLKHDEQHEQLQNILKSLGLRLEVEEISKLANRTQERLYGKKADSASAESRPEPGTQARRSPRSSRSSSSSSSSSSGSSSSGSSSRSRSCSSCSCGSSRSDGSGRRRTPGSDGSRKRLKVGDGDGVLLGEQHSYAQNQTCPPPNPGYSFPPLADYSLVQYSHYSTYSSHSSGPYQDAVSSYWTYSQVPAYPSSYPSSHAHPPDQPPTFPIAVLELTKARPRPTAQAANVLNLRCLKTVSSKPPRRKHRKKNRQQYKRNRKARQAAAKAAEKAAEQAREQAREQASQPPVPELDDQVVQPRMSSVSSVSVTKAKTSKKQKRRLSEEEVKANLRKTLDAFNRKVKEGVKQPVVSLTSQTDEDLLMKL